jgi:tripartite-type tricarboxylate transporter receptor subunit TctC
VPTFKELGVDGFESGTPTMLFAPKETPKSIVSALVKAVETSLADPAVVARLDGAGIIKPEVIGSDFAEKFLRGEVVKWGNVLRDAKD